MVPPFDGWSWVLYGSLVVDLSSYEAAFGINWGRFLTVLSHIQSISYLTWDVWNTCPKCVSMISEIVATVTREILGDQCWSILEPCCPRISHVWTHFMEPKEKLISGPHVFLTHVWVYWPEEAQEVWLALLGLPHSSCGPKQSPHALINFGRGIDLC